MSTAPAQETNNTKEVLFMSDDDTNGVAVAQPAEFLTARDVQHELRIGERLTYRLLKSGAIPSIKLNGLYRIPRKDFNEALESGAVLEVRK